MSGITKCKFQSNYPCRPLRLCLDCVTDVNRKCWCVTTKGMHAVGQVEVVVLLQCLPEEKSFPKDIFSHFIQLYRDSLTGQSCTHSKMQSFIESPCRSNDVFEWVLPTFESLNVFLSSLVTLTRVLPLYPCRKGCETSLAVLVRQPLPGHWGARRLPVHPLHSPVPSRSTSAQPALPLWPAGPQSRGGLGQSLSSASHAATGGRIQM